MKTIFLLFCLSLAVVNAHSQVDDINAPIKNFDALWKEFDERYANFELKEVNWKEVYEKYRPQINAQTSNERLFEICCTMIQELNDGHVTLWPGFKEAPKFCGPPYSFKIIDAFSSKEEWRNFQQIVDTTLLKHGFSKKIKCKVSKATNFQYRLSDELGYLRLDEMTEKSIQIKLNKALKRAINAIKDKKGLIIDLRFNGGGYDQVSKKIAERLISTKKLSHYKRERIKGTQQYTPLDSIYLTPKKKQQFTKPIVLLTSDFTASAAEVFVLSLMDLPYVTIIGGRTEGIFSDMYEFKLPNQWEASLSHQQFFSFEKKNYEGIGISPDIQIINTKEDLQTGADPVLIRAIAFLKSKHP